MRRFRIAWVLALAAGFVVAAAACGKDGGSGGAGAPGGAPGASAEAPSDETPSDENLSFEDRQKKEEAALRAVLLGEATRGPGVGVAVTAPPPRSREPGPAWFVVEKVGLVKLDAGVFTLVGGTEKFPSAAALAPDGAVWVVGSAVWRYEGDAPKLVGSREEVGGSLLTGVTVGPKGGVWAWGTNVIANYDGARWTTWKGPDFGDKYVFTKGIAVDGEGRAFVADSNRLFVYDGGAWKKIYDGSKLPEGKAINLSAPAIDANGALLIPTFRGMMRYADGALALGPRADGFQMGSGGHAFAPDGTFHAVSLAKLLVFGPDAKLVRVFEPAKSDVKAKAFRTVTPDARGRSWMATDNGVVVVNPDNSAVQWEPGTVPALSAQVKDIVVVGAGPELPAEIGPVATGTVRGHLFRGDVPAKGVRMELCPRPGMMFHKSPCENAAFVRSATLDDDGGFSFPDVPLNNYGVAAYVDGGWHTTMGAQCAGMKPGETCDLGRLTIRVDKK